MHTRDVPGFHRRRSVAKHDVTFSIPGQELGKVGVAFQVKFDGQALGRVRLSKGGVVWVRKNGQKGRRMSWTQFRQLMEKNGERE
jgi:hypothetical protein